MSVIPIIISAMLLLVLLIAGIFVYIILISYVLEFHIHLCPIRASSLVLSSTFGISDVLWCCSGLEKGVLGVNAVGRWLAFNSRCERFVLVLRFYGGFGDLSWDLCCWRVRKVIALTLHVPKCVARTDIDIVLNSVYQPQKHLFWVLVSRKAPGASLRLSRQRGDTWSCRRYLMTLPEEYSESFIVLLNSVWPNH